MQLLTTRQCGVRVVLRASRPLGFHTLSRAPLASIHDGVRRGMDARHRQGRPQRGQRPRHGQRRRGTPRSLADPRRSDSASCPPGRSIPRPRPIPIRRDVPRDLTLPSRSLVPRAGRPAPREVDHARVHRRPPSGASETRPKASDRRAGSERTLLRRAPRVHVGKIPDSRARTRPRSAPRSPRRRRSRDPRRARTRPRAPPSRAEPRGRSEPGADAVARVNAHRHVRSLSPEVCSTRAFAAGFITNSSPSHSFSPSRSRLTHLILLSPPRTRDASRPGATARARTSRSPTPPASVCAASSSASA